MTELKQVYKCNICGNIVEVLHSGAGELVCCGQPMQLFQEKEVEEGNEKHVPVVEEQEGKVIVKVGSVSHPMEEDHFIEWIELDDANQSSRKSLKPGDAPEAEFETKAENPKAREYCNLHGLWKSHKINP